MTPPSAPTVPALPPPPVRIPGRSPRPSLPVAVRRVGPAGVALAVGVLAILTGLRGTDVAAQAYHLEVLRLHGFVVWDSGWYGGSLPLSYSMLSSAAGALLGLDGASVAAAVVAAWCFDRIVRRVTGRRLAGSWYFAVSTVLAVAIGQLPYLCGEAAALGGVLAVVHGRTRLGMALGALSAAFSPLAAAFLVLATAAWAVHDRQLRRPMLLTAAAAGAVVVVVAAAFPGDGPFPFHWAGLVVVELLCAFVLSPLVRTPPAVRLAAAVYAVACVAAFVVPNPLGGNAPRLAASVGIPLVACLLTPTSRRAASAEPGPSGPPVGSTPTRPGRRRRLVLAAALLPFVVWQWAPGTGVVAAAAAPASTQPAFYQPLLAELATIDRGRPVRIEVVPTADHWESAYVAPQVSLARGWERQLDVGDNSVFYTPGALDASTYRAWLVDDGVSLVALPSAPLDYAGEDEATLLRAGRVPGLAPVWHSGGWQLWRVTAGPGLVTGPARLTLLAPDRLDLRFTRSGDALVRVRYTSYWHLVAGRACVRAAPGGWTEVRAGAGTVQLDAELVGARRAACPGQ